MAFWDNANTQDTADAFARQPLAGEEPRQANTTADEADSFIAQPEPEPVEMEAAQPVEEAAEIPEPVEEEATGEEKPEHAKRGRRGKQAGKPFPKLEADTVEKILTLGEALADERVLKLAQALTGNNSPKPSVQIGLLSEKKTQNRVGELAKLTDRLADAEPSDLKMLLVFTLGEDKQLGQLLFSALNALAPEQGFGKPSGDAMKDTIRFADKWGDGVDVSPVGLLKV